MKESIFIFFLSICLSFIVSGQSEIKKTFSFEDYMEIVRKYHPIAKQADLQIEKGEAYVLKSKGGFDPIIQGDGSQKYFDGSKYYSLMTGNLKVPTWFGVQLQTGYENTAGSRLNPQNYTPEDGLWYAGISVPLGKGLFIDQRRADLKQAKIFQESTAIERQIMINELLYEAGKAYYEWFKAYNKFLVYQDAQVLAETRFNAVKQSVVFGDKPAFDTLESGIQVQTRKFQVQQALLDWKNSEELLSVYLWGDNFTPLELTENIVPPLLMDVEPVEVDNSLISALDSLKTQHPDLLNYQFKIDFTKVEYRLNKENLKPTLDLKYNALSQPIGGNPFTEYSINNYNWGAQLVFPIFIRKGRGELKLTEVKLKEMENELAFKGELVEYKARMALNVWQTTFEQILIFNQTVNDYEKLVQGEQQLFNNGESSLFLINYRETSYVEAQVKLMDALTENLKSKMNLEFTLGILK
jgi:outer membrane protein TolC